MTLAQHTSVVIPAFNEDLAIGPLVTGLRAAAAWLEILVVDDGSTDETASARRRAGARVHPSSVQQGQRRGGQDRRFARRPGTFVLIIDADGQHRPADAARLVAHLDAYDLVVGARSASFAGDLVAARSATRCSTRSPGYLADRRFPI